MHNTWHMLAALVATEFTVGGASAADKATARALAATLAASGDAVAINYIQVNSDDSAFFQSARKACDIRGVI